MKKDLTEKKNELKDEKDELKLASEDNIELKKTLILLEKNLVQKDEYIKELEAKIMGFEPQLKEKQQTVDDLAKEKIKFTEKLLAMDVHLKAKNTQNDDITDQNKK
jgi:hypothetical protein